jgi:signal peptidase I
MHLRPVFQCASGLALVLLLLSMPPIARAAEPAPPSLWARASGWDTALMPSANMAPTLAPNEALLIDRRAHQTRALRAGDIVAYDVADDDKSTPQPGGPFLFVMRVVGVPGDRIALTAGRVVRNDRAMTEPYANLALVNVLTATAKEVVVPGDHVFVLGDNRGNSLDSRFTGSIPLSAIRGVVKFAGKSVLNGPFRSVELTSSP